MADEEAKLLQQARKLPWDERLAHKNWKCRNEAYIELAAVCDSITDPKDPRLQSFGGFFKKAVSDSNAPAQEKALDALIAFLKASDEDAGRYAKEVCEATAAKCLTGRTKTVEKAIVSFLLWIEIEAVEAFLDAMEKAVKNKVAKAVVPAIEAIYEALSGFGIKIVPPKRILKMLPDLFNHADEKVRATAKALAVELTRWIGKDSVKRLLFEGLREATQKDLENEIDKVDSRAVPTRTLRSEMAIVQEAEVMAEETGELAEEGSRQDHVVEEIDEYELCEPVDILTPLEKTSFYSGINITKWSERKEAVAELTKLASVRRIMAADFIPVTRILKKLVTDVNMAVSVEAITAAGCLASGLRQDYSNGSQILLPVLLEKLKEKKPAVVTALRDTLRNMFQGGCLTLADSIDDIRNAAKNKVPSARSETLLWVAECIEGSKVGDLLKIHKDYVPLLMESLQDTAPEVRDAAFSALANIAKTVGMKPLERSLEKLDDVRKKKLSEMIATAAPPPAAASSSKPGTQSHSASVPSSIPTTPGQLGARNAAASFLNKKPTAKTSAAVTGKPGGAKGKRSDAMPEQAEDIEPEDVNPETIEERSLMIFNADTLSKLKSAVWKERLEGISTLKEVLQVWTPQFDSNVETITRLLGISPGWTEKNVQVLQKIIEIAGLIANSATVFPKKMVVLCLNGMVEKVGDIKTRMQACTSLTAFCEVTGPQFVLERMYSIVNNSKNPKVLSEALAWMGQTVDDFGVKQVQIKGLIDFCKDPGLVSSTVLCRTAAIKVLGTLHKYIGPDLKLFLGEIKPALMAPIEAEFERNTFEGNIPAPSRTVKSDSVALEGSADAGSGESLPREDISIKLTNSLLENLSNPQWKVRQGALDSVNLIIEEANKRIQATGTGELFSALKARLSDTNKNLIILTMTTLANLAAAMGPPVEKASRGILTDILRCLSDPKKQMRESVLRVLDAWSAAVSVEKMMSAIGAELVNPKISTDGRKELIDWLVHHLPEALELTDILVLMKPMAANLQDKSSEVRKSTEHLLQGFIRICGFDMVLKGARSELSSSGMSALGTVMDRHRTAAGGSEFVEEHATSSRHSSTSTSRSTSVRTPRSAASTTPRTSKLGNVRPAASKASRSSSLLGAVDASLEGQPLFSLRESIKEERNKLMPRGVKVKFDQPGPETIHELEDDLKKFLREDVALRLCSKEFKLQVDGLEILRKAIPQHLKEFEEILDLMLRWCVLRFCESNTTGLMKVLDFLPDLFEALKGDDYMLTECETNIFLPCLVEKSGHNIGNIREKMRELIRAVCSICPASKVFAYVVDGVRSKNSRTRIEAVDHIGAMIDRYGIGIMGGSKVPLVSVAALTTERDAEIRKAALNTLSIAYKILGDDVWKQVGKLSGAQKGLLEDKFRWKAREMEKKKEGRPGDIMAALTHQQHAEDPSVSESIEREPAVTPAVLEAVVEPEEAPVVISPQFWSEAIGFIGPEYHVEQVVEGMKLICQELSKVTEDRDVVLIEEYAKDADTLVTMLTVQVANTFNLSFLPGKSSRPCKYVLNTLMQVFQITALGHTVTDEHLQALIRELLLWLLDERIPVITEDGHNLLKALNVLMLKILDNARPTSSMVVLISLLRRHSYMPSGTPSSDSLVHQASKFSELVVRCLIKLTKGLGQRMEQVDLDLLILSIHDYLQELGLDEIRRRAGTEDKPLRMVKTVLHELCKQKGPAVKGHLSLVPIDVDPPPIVLAYIDLNLQTLAASRVLTPAQPVEPIWKPDEDDKENQLEFPASGISDGMRKQLRLIFKKIGSKQTSADGLYDLWTITQLHPELDIFTYLQSSSEEMKRFIRNGLEQVQHSVHSSARHVDEGNSPVHSLTSPHATPGPPFTPAESQGQDDQSSEAEPMEIDYDDDVVDAEFRSKMAHLEALGAKYGYAEVELSGDSAVNVDMEGLKSRMQRIKRLGIDNGSSTMDQP